MSSLTGSPTQDQNPLSPEAVTRSYKRSPSNSPESFSSRMIPGHIRAHSESLRNYSYTVSFGPIRETETAAVNYLSSSLVPFSAQEPMPSRAVHTYSFDRNAQRSFLPQRILIPSEHSNFSALDVVNAPRDQAPPPPSFFVFCNQPQEYEVKEQEKEPEEDVSEEFILQSNAHIGNAENLKKAKRLLQKMRYLGNLDHSILPKDIPAARMGLCLLARLNHHEIKIEALDSLYEILNKDKVNHQSAFHLVPMAMQLMHHMNQDLFQTETIDIQIKIAKVYSLIAEQLQHHYAKKHTNGITKELRLQLSQTAQALEALNTQDDPKLSFYVKYALEGVLRLKDNRKELFDLLERFYHTMAGVLAIRGGQEVEFGLSELLKTFKDLDPHSPKAWYNGALILKDFAKKAMTDPPKIRLMQTLLSEKHKIFNWKFTYSALDLLYELTTKATNINTRKTAFMMLATFADYYELPLYLDFFKQIKHLNKPINRDPNIKIRLASIEYLSLIANEGPDRAIADRAKKILTRLEKTEKNEELKLLLSTTNSEIANNPHLVIVIDGP